MNIPGKLPPVHLIKQIKAEPASTAVLNQPIDAAQGDRVHLSGQARLLAAAREAVRQMPEVDLNKVNPIKARLQAGRYTVDPHTTALKMLQESLLDDLGQPR
jgi:flagellar biosynthesis anti-sigma factor FlgM